MFTTFDNDDRANAAQKTLDAYTKVKDQGAYAEEPLVDRVADLICDLMHLVRRDGEEERLTNGEPTSLLTRAQINFEDEEDEESEDED